MEQIFVIRDLENDEIITARNSMNNAIAAAVNRIAICGYMCESFDYDEIVTAIVYRDHDHKRCLMTIEAVSFKEGV